MSGKAAAGYLIQGLYPFSRRNASAPRHLTCSGHRLSSLIKDTSRGALGPPFRGCSDSLAWPLVTLTWSTRSHLLREAVQAHGFAWLPTQGQIKMSLFCPRCVCCLCCLFPGNPGCSIPFGEPTLQHRFCPRPRGFSGLISRDKRLPNDILTHNVPVGRRWPGVPGTGV